MAGEPDIWDGDEWEGHVLHLLQAEHGAHNVQKVPAKHLGDCGLDFICLHKQLVYQCYAVQEPVDVAVRADKQKSKIATDIKKFSDLNGGAAAILKKPEDQALDPGRAAARQQGGGGARCEEGGGSKGEETTVCR